VSVGFQIPELKEMNIVIQDEKECLFQSMESSQKEDMNVLILTCCSNQGGDPDSLDTLSGGE
jgi:hypothetical protein